MRDMLLDDGTVFRLGEDEYRLCTAERQIDWLLDSAVGFDVEVERDHRPKSRRSPLQGPTSCAVLKNGGLAGVERLKPFEIGHFTLGAARAHGLAHGLHRRSGIRAVDGRRRRRRRSGMR